MWHLARIDSDEPLQPPSKLRNSKCCSSSSLTVIEYWGDQQRLWSDCAYAQADLRFCWSHIPHCWKFYGSLYWKNLRLLEDWRICWSWEDVIITITTPASLRCGPLASHIYPSLVLVQPRKTRPRLTERLLMGRKESNQTKKITIAKVVNRRRTAMKQRYKCNWTSTW